MWQTHIVHTSINPSVLAAPVAKYSLAVVTDQPKRILHSSGIVPIAPDGSVDATLEGQAASVWSSIDSILVEAHMGVANIVAAVTYVVVGEDLGVVMAARDGFFGPHRAASTLITVPALARPEWKLEIAIVAID